MSEQFARDRTMTQGLPVLAPPQTAQPPPEPSTQLARRNTIFALFLAATVLLIAGGAVAVALIYVHYS